MYRKLLQSGKIADIETLGLHRGAGIYEASFFDLDTGRLSEYLFTPNLVTEVTQGSDDVTRLASSPDQRFVKQPVSTWPEAISTMLENKYGKGATPDTHASFLASQLRGEAAYIMGAPRDMERKRSYLAANGVKEYHQQTIDMDTFLDRGGALQRELKAGSTLWIANANFESKQFGAQLSARGNALNIKSRLQTYSSSADPFYVTGVEVNRAKTRAYLTNDWTGVWQAYLRETPKAGEVAVRDILDVTRAMQSYSKHLGLTKAARPRFVSIDVQASILERVLNLNLGKERHASAEDAAVHERIVLQEHARITEDLQQLVEKGPRARRILEEAAQGKGSLIQAIQIEQLLDEAAPALEKENLIKQLARAQEGFIQDGKHTVQTHIRSVFQETQKTPSGDDVGITRHVYGRRDLHSMDAVINHLSKHGRYTHADVRAVASEFMQSYDQLGRGQQAIEKIVTRATTERNTVMDSLLASKKLKTSSVLNVKSFATATRLPSMKGAMPAFGAAAVGLTSLGVLKAATTRRSDEPAETVLGYNYDQWTIAQEKQLAMEEQKLLADIKMHGLAQKGLAKERRPAFSDFASPYQGPIASDLVFLDQEMLAEREKYLREQFGAKHYDPVNGVLSFYGLKHHEILFRGGYKYVNMGKNVNSDKYASLQGEGLKELDLDHTWRVTAEDADTVVIRRGGVRGFMGDLFGLNKGYSFRLAGIDSPEVAHGSNAAHPGAEGAANALQAALDSAKNISLVYNPNDVSYGRMMAVIMADGQNLNMQAVRSGWAVHMPYGKPQDSMINYAALANIEATARKSRVGIWGNPWTQAYGDMTDKIGDRITFNQLAKRKDIVSHSGRMSMVAHMDQVQAMGHYTEADQMISQDIGSMYNHNESLQAVRFEAVNKPHLSFIDEQKSDLAKWTRTHGKRTTERPYSARGGYSMGDKVLAIDTAGNTNSAWNAKRAKKFDLYSSQRSINHERRRRQAEAQRMVNQGMFISPINHTRM